jgi:hypothetical protein
MGWGWGSSESAVRKAETIAQESKSSTDQLLAILIAEVSGLRQELADERNDAEMRRTQESRRSR